MYTLPSRCYCHQDRNAWFDEGAQRLFINRPGNQEDIIDACQVYEKDEQELNWAA